VAPRDRGHCYGLPVRIRIALLVPAAAVAAGVLAGVAAVAAGASAVVVVSAALAVLLLGGLQVLVIQHLRRLQRRVDRIDRALDKARWTTQGGSTEPVAGDVGASKWVGGVPLPPDLLRFMREDDAKFLATGDQLASLLAANGLTANSSVLEAGCGYGRLAVGLLRRRDFDGSYLGFDILPRHMAWCTGTISKVNNRYIFKHLDLFNDRYNPSGSLDPDVAEFPAADGSFDVCALFSVFTHLFQPTVEHYLNEIARVLRPGGIAVTTWLVFDEERLPEVVSDSAAYPLRLEHADGSRFMLAEDPLRAIGFDRDAVVAMANKAGLDVSSIELGYWAGGKTGVRPGAEFQDVVVLAKPS
jgi:SAM-dependent methyltransferase